MGNHDDVFVEVVELEQEIIRLRELNREMVEVLKEIEWLEIWDDYVDGPLYNCPVCGNLAGNGHNEDCTLGKILAKVGGLGGVA